MSGTHCRIRSERGKYYVSNLSRTNPTKVNGTEIREETEIRTGDILTIGIYNFRFEIC